MQFSVIIDVVLAVVLLGGMILGIKRGLFLSLAGLVVLIVALVGAGFVAKTLTPPITQALTPLLEQRIEKRVDGMLQQPEAETGQPPPVTMPEGDTTEDVSAEIERVLELLGLGESVRERLGQQVWESIRETSVSVVGAVTKSLLDSVVHTVLFFLSFVVLTLVLRLVVRALDLVLRLPGLHFLNAAGGAVVGLLQGALLLFVCVWVLDRFGWLPSRSVIGDTYLLQFFVTNGATGFISSL